MKKALAAALPLALFATAAIGQTTHIVGPGGFVDINDALTVAAPGDLILVAPGVYGNVLANVGVTIRALGTVSAQSVVLNLTAAHTMHVVGLSAWSMSITGGRVTLDNCSTSIESVVTSSDVRLQSCSMTVFAFGPPGAHPGLRATNSSITAIDCVFRGSTALAESGTSSHEAIVLENSTFFGSHLTATGGSGYAGLAANLQPKAALRTTASLVQVSDSTFMAGTALFGGMQPCAVDAQTGRLVRCTLVPSCTPVIATGGSMLGLHRPAALQSPGPFSLEFNTDPNGLVGVYFATGLGYLAVPGLEQPILLDVATTFHLELLTANAVGVASGTWNVPAGLTNQTFFFQAVGTAPAPSLLQLSPVAGGIVR